MLISFSNRFVYIKSRKTGGTSLEIALSCICRPPDLRAAIYAPDEALLREMEGIASTPTFNGVPLGPHMSANRIRALIPEEWPNLYRFTVERHPYEKVVSRAYWCLGRSGKEVEDLSATIDDIIDRHVASDRELYTIDGELAVDRVFFHERLEEAREELSQKFGRQLPPLPRAKGQFRQDRRPATEILSAVQKRRIRDLTAWEFEQFGFAP